MSKPTIRGLLVPNITPTDNKGRLDEEKLREYVDWIIGKGIDGCTPMAVPANSFASHPKNDGV